jgi:hypothetical protein
MYVSRNYFNFAIPGCDHMTRFVNMGKPFLPLEQ